MKRYLLSLCVLVYAATLSGLSQPQQKVRFVTYPPDADLYLRGSFPGNEKFIGKSGQLVTIDTLPNAGFWEIVVRHPDGNHQEKVERLLPKNERWPAQGTLILPGKTSLEDMKDAFRYPTPSGIASMGLLSITALGLIGLLVKQKSKTRAFETKEQTQLDLNERLIAAGGVLKPGVNQFEQLGDYYLLDELGAGGMGRVYLAVEKSLAESGEPIFPKQLVAIKVILPDAVEKDAQKEEENQKDPTRPVALTSLQRFEREARTGLLIKHPNCIRTFSFHSLESTRYLVMEYVQGKNLADVIQARAQAQNLWGFPEALQIFKQLCAAMQYAHDLHIVHRDLKPDNVMVLHDKASHKTTVKIMDFGLARRTGKMETQARSATGDLMGHQAYLAPECYGEGGSQAFTDHPERDQFSLGLIFYEMLTGQRRISNDTELIQFIFAKKVNPADSYPKLPQLPTVLVDAIEKMYTPDHTQRYSSVSEAYRTIETVAQKHQVI